MPIRLRRAAGSPDPYVAVERGLAVFAIPPGGTRPTVRGWQRNCLRTVAEVRACWRAGDNVGIGCWASGVVGLDLDVADGRHHTDVDGAGTLAELAAAYVQPWPDTLTVTTPSGGRHLYFRAPPGVVIGSTSGGRSPLGPGIDTRGPGRGGAGGYLIGPTSAVPGGRYTITSDQPVRELPSWLANILTRRPAALG